MFSGPALDCGRWDGVSVGLYVKPTIFSEVRTDMRIAQEEIFGPVLCIFPYDTVDEAVAIADDTVYGLGAHVQGEDIDVVKDVASRIRAGQVHLNYPACDPHAPFGGFKAIRERTRIRPRRHVGISRGQIHPRLFLGVV
jgi:aldehyde dehydrogenase (NAD+)